MAITRQFHRAEFARLGLEGEALELFVRERAAERHRSRVEDVEVAFKGHLHILFAVGIADRIGVGGRADLQGEATDRLPLLRAFGKGRKYATDGGAWSAAIEYNLRRFEGWVIQPSTSEAFPLEVVTPSGKIYPVGWDVVPPRWARVMAHRAITQMVSPPDWHQEAFPLAGDIPAWGKLLNVSVEMAETWDESRELEKLPRIEEDGLADWERELLSASPISRG